MNLLIVSQYFWPESFRINDLARRLSAQGVNVSVLTGNPNYPEGRTFQGYSWRSMKRESLDAVEILRVPLVPRGAGRALQLIANYLSFVLTASLIGPFLVRRRSVDVIFVYGISPILQAIPAIFLKWTKRAKLVVWVQDLWPESLEATGFVKNRLILSLVGRVVKWIYHHADFVFVQSEAFIEPVAELCAREKIVYYPNSAEDAMTSTGAEVECPIPALKQYFSVVFAGALGTAQALDVILDAAERLKHEETIRFFLVGHGSRSEWARTQIEARQLTNVVMAGRYPVEAMPGVFADSSVLLVTLTDDPIFSKTVPSKVQSYLASGRPIIGCINGEGARVIDNAKAGVTCKAMDVDGLVQAVETLYRMPESEREALGKNGRRYFEKNFESHTLATELIDRFRSIIGVASFEGGH
jgi:glycosyltransferase involved in cell wall biosynthesis